MHSSGHTEQLRPIPGHVPGSLDAAPIDQLVGRDAHGVEQHVLLFSTMSVDGLRRALIEAGLSDGPVAFNCAEGNLDTYRTLLVAVWPGAAIEEHLPTESGIHPVPVTMTFVVTHDYWRALAKIGFHYYLTHRQRDLRGDEPVFAALRTFIMQGGDPLPFFASQGATFTPGLCLNSGEWGHILSLSETSSTLQVYIHLFRGPGTPSMGHTLTLGHLDRPVEVPTAIDGHVYRYDPGLWPMHAGRVEHLPIVNRTILTLISAPKSSPSSPRARPRSSH
jgi:hypothetical protein